MVFLLWRYQVQRKTAGETISLPGVFSYQVPIGWKQKKLGKKTDFVQGECFKDSMDDFPVVIYVLVYHLSGSLAEFVKSNEINLRRPVGLETFQIVDEESFVTASEASGKRIAVTCKPGNENLRQTFYFFRGSGDTKLVVTATCPADSGVAYASIFDSILKTFSPQ